MDTSEALRELATCAVLLERARATDRSSSRSLIACGNWSGY